MVVPEWEGILRFSAMLIAASRGHWTHLGLQLHTV